MRKLRLFFTGKLFPCILFLLICFAAGVALTFWLPRALAPIAIVERFFSLVIAVLIACSPALPATKTAKLLLLLLLPWTGAFLCILWRNHANASPFLRHDPPKSVVEEVANLADTQVCFAKDLTYFPGGCEAFAQMLCDIHSAERRIYLEFYILSVGKLWNRIYPLLAEKAAAGVKVCILTDGFGSALTLPKSFAKNLRARGIGFAVYRPLRVPFGVSDRRNHRKIAVIDGVAYTGGINLADEYAGEIIRFGHWKDTAVRVTGTPAEQLATLFREDWRLVTGEDLPAEQVEGGRIPCTVFADDGAERRNRSGPRVLFRLFSTATRTLYLNTPYLAPDGGILDALKTCAGVGVDVRIMIPHIPDKKAVFCVTRNYARELELAGVRVREYEAGFLHAKSAVVDGKYSVVSSYNLDCRSLYLQAECGLFAEDATLANELERDFLAAWETGVPVPKASVTEKFFGSLVRLFSPLI